MRTQLLPLCLLLVTISLVAGTSRAASAPSTDVELPARPAGENEDDSNGPDRAGEASIRFGSELNANSSPMREAGRLALARGLAWLAAEQARQPDGSFPLDGAGPQQLARVGVSALATLALMAGGSTPDRGPHGQQVSRGIEYLLSKIDLQSPPPLYGFIRESGDEVSRNHGHGYATLALAQAYAVSRQTRLGERIHAALVAAVRCVEESQGSEGGWGYTPTERSHEGSTTICLVQGLRAAHNVGIRVDTTVIARALEYVVHSQKKDGSFRYRLGEDRSSVALTAAAISTLNATGTYSGPEVDLGYEFIWSRLHSSDWSPDKTWPFYERLYLSQALFQHSDARVFETWVEDERKHVLTDQEPDGSWSRVRRPGGGWSEVSFGAVYGTAINCLFLALPEGQLPIFQR